MDSIRVSEAPDPGSIPGEATFKSSKMPVPLNFEKEAASLVDLLVDL